MRTIILQNDGLETSSWGRASLARTKNRFTSAARNASLGIILSISSLSSICTADTSLPEGGQLQEISIQNHFGLEQLELSTGPERANAAWGEPAANHLWVVPVMASNPGQFGAYFKTRVVVTNLTNNAFQVGVSLFNSEGKVKDTVLSLDPKKTLVWNDFLAQALNYTGAGAVVFDSWLGAATGPEGNRFVVTAEVYSDSPHGRFKTVVNRGRLWEQFEPASQPFNVGVTVSPKERTNLGAFNASSFPNTVTAQIYSTSGALVETVQFELPPFAWGQRAVTQPVTNGVIRWKLTAKAYLYAVTVSNDSNDGTMMTAVDYDWATPLAQQQSTVADAVAGGRLEEISSLGDADLAIKNTQSLSPGPAKQGLVGVASATYMVPAMASAPGQFGAYFKTKVVLTNATEFSYPIYATLYNNNGKVKRVSLQMQPHQTVCWDDFLSQAMGYAGAGAMYFDSWYAPPNGSYKYAYVLTAEVYSESPGGRYKTLVSDGPEWIRQQGGNVPYNIGINVSATERTNIGALNFFSSKSLAVTAEVFDASGTLIETVQFNLRPAGWEQKALTVPVTNGTIRWKMPDDAYLYAVTVDNTSNDGTMMPAVDYH